MKALVCWSGGKDSALALHLARNRSDFEIVGLLTTFSEEFDRVSMHGVRRSLLEAQAQALQLPVYEVFLPTPPAAASCGVNSSSQGSGFTVFATNDSYEAGMLRALQEARDRGVEAVVFGDIFLEDLRQYRERLLDRIGLRCVFPLWGRSTRELFQEVVQRGFVAVVTCIDAAKLDSRWVGRRLDQEFLEELPASVDPCGEYGEYHSFVVDGPGFRRRIPFAVGETVARSGFWFCDLLGSTPGSAHPADRD